MADLTLTAGLLAGNDVDETALKAEIEAADMKGESFFSPAYERTNGMQVLEAIETISSGDERSRQEVAERARALLGRAEEIAQNADERDLLVARLKHRMEEDGLPEPTDDELGRIAKLMRVVHGVEVDVHQPKWEPPRAVLDVDPNTLHTADTGPVIGPAAVPPPHVQRRLARKMRDRDREHDRGRDDTPARADAKGTGRTGSGRTSARGDATSRSGGAAGASRGGSSATHAGVRTDTASATGAGSGTRASATGSSSAPTASTSTGSGGGGPNTAHAEVHINWPPGMTMPVPASTPAPAPSAPALDAATVQRMLDDAQRRGADETRRGLEAVQQSVDALLTDDSSTFKGWLLNTGFGQALIAILLLSGLLGIAWWATKPTEHVRVPVTTQLGTE